MKDAITSAHAKSLWQGVWCSELDELDEQAWTLTPELLQQAGATLRSFLPPEPVLQNRLSSEGSTARLAVLRSFELATAREYPGVHRQWTLAERQVGEGLYWRLARFQKVLLGEKVNLDRRSQDLSKGQAALAKEQEALRDREVAIRRREIAQCSQVVQEERITQLNIKVDRMADAVRLARENMGKILRGMEYELEEVEDFASLVEEWSEAMGIFDRPNRSYDNPKTQAPSREKIAELKGQMGVLENPAADLGNRVDAAAQIFAWLCEVWYTRYWIPFNCARFRHPEIRCRIRECQEALGLLSPEASDRQLALLRISHHRLSTRERSLIGRRLSFSSWVATYERMYTKCLR